MALTHARRCAGCAPASLALISSSQKEWSSWFRNMRPILSADGFNTAALTLVQQAIRRGITVPVYDWFLYQLISGAGGVILFDREPAVLYRQHHTNAIGAARGFRPRLWRLMQMARGRYRHWNDANLTALTQVKDLLSSAHQTDLQRVCKARSCHLVPRLRLLWRSRIRRFSIEGFLALWISITFNQF